MKLSRNNKFLKATLTINTTFGTQRCTCLLRNQFCHHISGVDIDGADGHDLLPVSRWKFSQKKCDQCVQLWNLEGWFFFKYERSNGINTETNRSIFIKNALIIKQIPNLLSELIFKTPRERQTCCPSFSGKSRDTAETRLSIRDGRR